MVIGWLLGASAAWAGDKDGDSVPNKTDACKEEAEDADGFQDEDGCPDPDNDGDGRADVDDKCAAEPEDTDGFDDEDGCPDPDNDGDGVLDADDRCGDEKESGEDQDGYPLVTLQLLSDDGWMASVGQLSQTLLAAVGKKAEGCDEAAKAASDWLAANDAAKLAAQWDARLGRAPAEFDKQAAIDLLGQKNGVYQTLAPAIAIYCKEHAGWTEVSTKVAAVFEKLPQPPPPPKPTKKKK